MLECVKDFLKLLILEFGDLSLRVFMFMSSETALELLELDIVEMWVWEVIFTTFLLDATIQDGGMRERSIMSPSLFYCYFISEQLKIIQFFSEIPSIN